MFVDDGDLKGIRRSIFGISFLQLYVSYLEIGIGLPKALVAGSVSEGASFSLGEISLFNVVVLLYLGVRWILRIPSDVVASSYGGAERNELASVLQKATEALDETRATVLEGARILIRDGEEVQERLRRAGEDAMASLDHFERALRQREERASNGESILLDDIVLSAQSSIRSIFSQVDHIRNIFENPEFKNLNKNLHRIDAAAKKIDRAAAAERTDGWFAHGVTLLVLLGGIGLALNDAAWSEVREGLLRLVR